ncbi:hypothetical protein [Kutzneria sp. CA-103260]|uniref:hypothetical protein n=1 Tax=Kutzneria sp. CA-103260 TaxID=2802641 RepID=UPI001BA90EAD|nr:hypothetical protein [Kutzneria sp. CA-103260]QUQ69492.1 hypothetical protein JJ691_72500 [Kutzneria sp. CA-103260]
MAQAYPIVEQRSLGAARKRGPFGWGRQTRDEGELLKPNAHETLVYRVNGQYVVDNARRGLGHEQVVEASHMSLVDMSRDMPVMVRLEIPSCEASPFTVQVTFLCTVNDPVVVVREGLSDAENVLGGYLRRHQRIFELGQDYRIDQINDVRRDVNAQITAFTVVDPPIEPGMLIKTAGVEVLTPDELVEFERRRRQQRQENTIASERIRLEHSLDTERERNAHHLNDVRQRNTNDLEDARQQHEHERDYREQQQTFLSEADAQRHNQMLAAERGEFERAQFREVMELIGSDPVQAVQLAYANGTLNPTEFAEQLRFYQERELSLEEAQQVRDREDRLALQKQEREDRLLELAAQREERALAREDRRIVAEAEREDRRRERQWHRDDRLRLEKSNREDQQQRVKTNLEMLQKLIERGSFDNLAINLEKVDSFVNNALEAAQGTSVDAAAPDELPARSESEQAIDVDVREEDAG